MKAEFIKPLETDWKAIANIHIQSWRDSYANLLTENYLQDKVVLDKEKEWQDRFKDPAQNQEIIALKTENKLIGFVCLFIDKDPDLGTYIDNLHVLNKYKGHGLGRKLMQEAASYTLQNSDLSKYWLLVFSGNTAAKGFYEKVGGKLIDTKIYDSPDGQRLPVDQYVWEDFRLLQ